MSQNCRRLMQDEMRRGCLGSPSMFGSVDNTGLLVTVVDCLKLPVEDKVMGPRLKAGRFERGSFTFEGFSWPTNSDSSTLRTMLLLGAECFLRTPKTHKGSTLSATNIAPDESLEKIHLPATLPQCYLGRNTDPSWKRSLRPRCPPNPTAAVPRRGKHRSITSSNSVASWSNRWVSLVHG